MSGDGSWLAELRCPVPPRLCQHADAVQEWLVDWADRVGGPLDAVARERIARGGVARYAGRLYPDATEADLRVLATLFTWFFLLDDACDATRRPRPAEVAALCEGVLRLLRAGAPPAPALRPAQTTGTTPAPRPRQQPSGGTPTPDAGQRTTGATPAPNAGQQTTGATPTPNAGQQTTSATAAPRSRQPAAGAAASPRPGAAASPRPGAAAPPRPGQQTTAAPGGRHMNQAAARLTSPPPNRLVANQSASRSDAFDGPLRRMLADAWQVPHRRMSAAWQDRFVDAVAHHLDGVVTEATNKASGRLPSVAEYIPLRRATSAAYVSYALIEFATGRPVPDAVYHHPAVRQVADTANDLLSWFNDLLSLGRDAATSGGHNLVLAVAREQRIPVDAAVRAVVRRWQRSMRRFVELREAVPSFGPALDGPLRQYLDGLANSVRGTMDWSLESARYRDALPAARPAGRSGKGRYPARPGRPTPPDRPGQADP